VDAPLYIPELHPDQRSRRSRLDESGKFKLPKMNRYVRESIDPDADDIVQMDW